MGRLVNVLVLLLAIAGGFYQLYLKHLLYKAGFWREVESVGSKDCTAISELEACEKLVLHQPTGVIYLACSHPANRRAWMPPIGRFNASGASFNDYVATYDHASSRVTRLNLANFNSPRGLSVHGMDVVPSSSSSSELFVYLINHRAPLDPQAAPTAGADSCVEIFKTVVGSDTLTHVRTVEDPAAIITPNDIVGYPDGQSFYFTNDHGEKVGLVRALDMFGRASTSVGYCHAKHGCKLAITKLHGSNGIARAQNDTIYVTNSLGGVLSILERQTDNSLVITDVVHADRMLDNAAVDSEGALWVAGFPKLASLYKHAADPSTPAPSSALRLTINTGAASFYGAKHKLEKVFEDDGSVASGITSVAHDAERRRLFLHGLLASHLTICKV
ncbi:putative serum paraoxonase arylesterase [Lyophyllum shimeji]|uniref:Serum paraoxonase arylesterase n=1 Tax=Lyophyllum shimeji TaxID=47721 RepID=A0A9P3PPZ8_LYOSH|nr:putative serum paraoxonase arylesterase [Lyophyllum shimeji]